MVVYVVVYISGRFGLIVCNLEVIGKEVYFD